MYDTPLILPLQNRQPCFNSCFVQILTPSTFLTDLPCRNHVNNMFSGPLTPLSASTAVASAPLPYDNFSAAKLLKFCQHAIPTFLTLCHDPNGFVMLNTTSNSAPITPACSPLYTIPTPSATL